jgi:hypothetical protein
MSELRAKLERRRSLNGETKINGSEILPKAVARSSNPFDESNNSVPKDSNWFQKAKANHSTKITGNGHSLHKSSSEAERMKPEAESKSDVSVHDTVEEGAVSTEAFGFSIEASYSSEKVDISAADQPSTSISNGNQAETSPSSSEGPYLEQQGIIETSTRPESVNIVTKDMSVEIEKAVASEAQLFSKSDDSADQDFIIRQYDAVPGTFSISLPTKKPVTESSENWDDVLLQRDSYFADISVFPNIKDLGVILAQPSLPPLDEPNSSIEQSFENLRVENGSSANNLDETQVSLPDDPGELKLQVRLSPLRLIPNCVIDSYAYRLAI